METKERRAVADTLDTSHIRVDELLIADDMMAVVKQETRKIFDAHARDEKDLAKLEKLAKIYSTLMASHRENVKFGVFGNLAEKELKDAVDGTDSTDAAD